jgi:hypothetical protein
LVVSDDELGMAERQAELVVKNAAPTIEIIGAGSVNEGATYTLTLGTVTDPGADEVTLYMVQWGDGTSDTYDSAGDKTHVYAAGGTTRTIKVHLFDEDGMHVNRANALSVGVNAAPTVGVPAAQTAYEDVDKALSGITVGDRDGDSLTVTLAVGHGKLSLGTTSGLSVTGNGSASVTLAGSVAALNAALAGLVYRGRLNFRGADALSVTAGDGRLSTSGSVAIAVKSAARQAADIRAQVGALRASGVLNRRQADSLNLEVIPPGPSAGKVREFLDRVRAFRAAGVLTRAEADLLQEAATVLLFTVTRR